MPSGHEARRARKEPLFEQIASFVGFFIYLLILKTFFLPLFIIPTGSMAETLYGDHATHTCPNCGVEYPVGLPPRSPIVQCPNCRWREHFGSSRQLARLKANGVRLDGGLHGSLRRRAGDRIMVHGWPYQFGGPFAPQRWDVVVFKVPSDGQTNYIKRLIGKPGEIVEIIDGDIFITDPKTGVTRIAHKTPQAQQSLWFACYNHDYPALRPADGGTYHPRWVALEEGDGWNAVQTRRPQFDGLDGRRGEIRFVTVPGPTDQPGEITDIYGYNSWHPGRIVTDVRLSCEVTIETAGEGGFVELSATKYVDRFFARLYADGRLTLEHATEGDSQRQIWGEAQIGPLDGPVRLALSSVDYVVSVEIDGRPVPALTSTPRQYDSAPEQARRRSENKVSPRLGIAAQNVRAALAHVLIERDVFYTSDVRVGLDDRPGYGTQGNPITLGENDYFVLGDNSPASLDCRFSFSQTDKARNKVTDPIGPHLKVAFERGEYRLGTVPADQLIGPAFFVYWPGTDALLPDQYLPQWLKLLNQLPGPGQIRWIH